jgi:hypothetical protein
MNGEGVKDTEDSSEDSKLDLLRLYGIQMQSLHQQLNHILLIRSWAATLAVGLLIALVNFREPIIAFGTGMLGVFWVLDRRFGDPFTIYLKRERALRESLLENMSSCKVKAAFTENPKSPRTRHWYYITMFAIVLVPAVIMFVSDYF